MRDDMELMVLKVVPTTATLLFRTTSAFKPLKPVTTLDTRPNDRCALRAKRTHQQRKLMQKRRVPYEFRHPRQRAYIRRQSDVHLFDAGPPGRGVGRGGAQGVERKPNAMLCTAAITRWGIQARALMAFWKSRRCGAYKGRTTARVSVLRERVRI